MAFVNPTATEKRHGGSADQFGRGDRGRTGAAVDLGDPIE